MRYLHKIQSKEKHFKVTNDPCTGAHRAHAGFAVLDVPIEDIAITLCTNL